MTFTHFSDKWNQQDRLNLIEQYQDVSYQIILKQKPANRMRGIVTVRSRPQPRRNRSEKVIGSHIHVGVVSIQNLNSCKISKYLIGRTKSSEAILVVDDLVIGERK
jgi:hypothetical protein